MTMCEFKVDDLQGGRLGVFCMSQEKVACLLALMVVIMMVVVVMVVMVVVIIMMAMAMAGIIIMIMSQEKVASLLACLTIIYSFNYLFNSKRSPGQPWSWHVQTLTSSAKRGKTDTIQSMDRQTDTIRSMDTGQTNRHKMEYGQTNRHNMDTVHWTDKEKQRRQTNRHDTKSKLISRIYRCFLNIFTSIYRYDQFGSHPPTGQTWNELE